jgi:hypothetical protein
MATIAIGDVHGNCAALDDLLRQLTTHVGPGDVVVFLGDYIDRGPKTRECIDRYYYQSPDCLCTHGGLDPRVVSVHDQPSHALIWGAAGFPAKYDGPQTVVYGHRNNAIVNAEGWPSPAILGQTIGIDTISHGVLTAVRLPDQRVFQSARFKAPSAV